MDVEIVKKHWKLIELVSLHDYVTNGSNGAVLEIADSYGLPKQDIHCGYCVIQMMKTIYNQYKDKV